MALIGQPPTGPVDIQARGDLVEVQGGWRNFFNALYNICNGLTMSGTTARRPTVGLWVGRPYLDTTLGIPIWLQSINPNVWINSAGAPV